MKPTFLRLARRLRAVLRETRSRCAVMILMAGAAFLTGWAGCHYSVTCDEVGHLAAGLYSWEFGRFDLYRVNPPLVRLLATLPVVLTASKSDWSAYRAGTVDRTEWKLGQQFIAANADNWFTYFAMARLALIPLVLLGGYVCYRWASELHGPAAGLLALTLWCFSPNIIAWGSTICPDVTAAALGVAAAYMFWRWLKQPTWTRVGAAGVVMGLALLTKMTWIILFGVYPLMWLVSRVAGGTAGGWSGRETVPLPNETSPQLRQTVAQPGETVPQPRETVTRPAALFGSSLQLSVILLLGLYVLNVGYGFEGSFKLLGDFTFASATLTGIEAPRDTETLETPQRVGHSLPEGNRFKDSWIGRIPVPFPENYVRGIDLQKFDFECGKWSYLCGEWKYGGWWYYYLCVALWKEPLGTWCLGLLALVLTVCRREYRSTWRDEVVLLLPAVAVFVFVSSETGFSRYFRYVLPCFPFAFIWISKVGRCFEFRATGEGSGRSLTESYPETREQLGQAPNVVFGASPVSSGCGRSPTEPQARPQVSTPHSARRFVMPGLVGALLVWSVGSSLSVYPHSMSYFNKLAGGPKNGHHYLVDANIDWGQDLWFLKNWYDAHPDARPLRVASTCFVPPRYYGIEYQRPSETPHPGWYAMSVDRLHSRDHRYDYFFKLKPVAMAGYSIYIYHVTPEEAHRLRAEAGLPALEAL